MADIQKRATAGGTKWDVRCASRLICSSARGHDPSITTSAASRSRRSSGLPDSLARSSATDSAFAVQDGEEPTRRSFTVGSAGALDLDGAGDEPGEDVGAQRAADSRRGRRPRGGLLRNRAARRQWRDHEEVRNERHMPDRWHWLHPRPNALPPSERASKGSAVLTLGYCDGPYRRYTSATADATMMRLPARKRLTPGTYSAGE